MKNEIGTQKGTKEYTKKSATIKAGANKRDYSTFKFMASVWMILSVYTWGYILLFIHKVAK